MSKWSNLVLLEGDTSSGGSEVLSLEPLGEHDEALLGSELRNHVSSSTDGDKAEVHGVDSFEAGELILLVHPRLPERDGRIGEEARSPVLRTSEGHRSVNISRVDEDTNAVLQQVLVDGHGALDVVVVVGVDDIIANTPLDVLVDMEGRLDISAVQPDLSLARVDARNLRLSTEESPGSLTVVALNSLRQGTLV